MAVTGLPCGCWSCNWIALAPSDGSLSEVLWLFLSAGEPLACTHPWTVQPLWTAPSARQGVPDGRFEICSHSAEGVALAWFFVETA